MIFPKRIPGANLLPADQVLRRVVARSAAPRSGLAPVELVLSIPLLLMVMALSVIVGNAACWKIRAAVVARNEIWSTRQPRSDTPADPWPAGWPQSAKMNHSGSRPLSDLNLPAFQNPLVHGPLPNVTVNSQLFDPTLSVHVGSDYIERTPAMLPRLGDYSFNVEHPLIDGTWAYWQTGQYSNETRRMPSLYPNTPHQNSGEKAAYDEAYQSIATASFRGNLAVLDHDEELRAFYGNYPNFHPAVRSFCSLDPSFVRDNYMANSGGLLTQIANVPKTITNRFLSMYRSQLATLKAILQAAQQVGDPPPPGIQAQIAALEQKVQTLQDYLASLN
jgi:hypothetical protein